MFYTYTTFKEYKEVIAVVRERVNKIECIYSVAGDDDDHIKDWDMSEYFQD